MCRAITKLSAVVSWVLHYYYYFFAVFQVFYLTMTESSSSKYDRISMTRLVQMLLEYKLRNSAQF